MLYSIAPPLAPNRTMCDEASVTGNASSEGLWSISVHLRSLVVGARPAPPLAVVSVGIHASLLLGSVGFTSNRPGPAVC